MTVEPTMTQQRWTLLLSLVLVAAGGCIEDGSRTSVELPKGDACGEALFWATTTSGDIAVTAFVDAADRSRLEPTTIEFVVPDDSVRIEVLEGRDLSRSFCTDLPDRGSEPTRRLLATAGSGTITLAPAATPETTCGRTGGDLKLSGLVAEDGTRFAPITVSSASIGCYAG